jgi:hypothetical protein
MVPSHLSLKKLSEVLLLVDGEQQIQLKNAVVDDVSMSDTVGQVFKKFLGDIKAAQANHNVLDLSFSIEALTSSVVVDEVPQDTVQFVQSCYMPNNVFFDQFEKRGGVKTLIARTLQSLSEWKDQKAAEQWKLWLQEVQSFAEIPSFFKAFFKNRQSKELLFKVLSGDPDKDSDPKHWDQQ